MPWYPDDWFVRHPGACFAMLVLLICLAGCDLISHIRSLGSEVLQTDQQHRWRWGKWWDFIPTTPNSLILQEYWWGGGNRTRGKYC